MVFFKACIKSKQMLNTGAILFTQKNNTNFVIEMQGDLV